ncbi:protease inhibitor I42 family protein [Marinobacterium arenosum]|uniref:protease inhibitor I42 family protein n=1 Tax=Marinobacterium arenosum TaxID=2862496 RepID=UPI001C93E98C|nr:protease inhibitor I42 family protein [Marinobacterium arenosum]MBY4676180.1 protease inhibitor I42 family protein [Marinobacterium arenosum]
MLPPIKVKVGEPIVIQLEDNPSTGFNVCLTEMPQGIALADVSYLPGQALPGMVGVPGTRRFTFIALAPCEGPLLFNQIKFTHPEPTVQEPTPMENRFVIVES